MKDMWVATKKVGPDPFRFDVCCIQTSKVYIYRARTSNWRALWVTLKLNVVFIPIFKKSRKNIHTMRIQSMYFLHHGASLLESTGDCVNGGWVEVRRRVLNPTKLLNKLKHPKWNNMILFFSDEKKNSARIKCPTSRKTCGSLPALRMSLKWWKPSFLRRCSVMSPTRAPAHLWGRVKGQHQHLPRVHRADSVALNHRIAGGHPWVWQQDSSPCHVINRSMARLQEHCYDLVTKEQWPSSSPDLNPMDYFIWSYLQAHTNRRPHTTKVSLIVS